MPVPLVYTGIKSPDTAGADEWDLDTQTSTGIAPAAKKLYIYVATSLSDADLARSVNTFAAQNVARSGLGLARRVRRAALPRRLDGRRRRRVRRGRRCRARRSSPPPVTPAAPAPSRRPTASPAPGLPDTEYPASSPYVVGVGGTTLAATDADAYTDEITWNAGGGGISPVENGGYWQTDVVPELGRRAARRAGRGLRRRPEHRRADHRRRRGRADRRHQPLLAAGAGAVDAAAVQPRQRARLRPAEAVRDLQQGADHAAAAADHRPGRVPRRRARQPTAPTPPPPATTTRPGSAAGTSPSCRRRSSSVSLVDPRLAGAVETSPGQRRGTSARCRPAARIRVTTSHGCSATDAAPASAGVALGVSSRSPSGSRSGSG